MKLSKYKVGIIAAGIMAMQTCSVFAAEQPTAEQTPGPLVRVNAAKKNVASTAPAAEDVKRAVPTPTASEPVKGSEAAEPVNSIVVGAKGNAIAVAKGRDEATRNTKPVAQIGVDTPTVTPAPASDEAAPAVQEMPVPVKKMTAATARTNEKTVSTAAKPVTDKIKPVATAKPVTPQAEPTAATESAPLQPTAPVTQTATKLPEIKQPEPVAQPATEPARIVINTANRALYLYKNGKSVRMYPVAVGKPSTPTPVGYYSVIEKDMNPVWIDPDDPTNRAEAGEGNPLGQRWLGIGGNYGIHGNSNESSISHYVSNGCIRLHNDDINELYDLVEVGTPVEIYYNRCVVNKNGENTVAYYIYPDAYSRQPLTVSDVNKWLDDFSVGDFVSNDEIQSKIDEEDGEPTYIAKVYPVYVNGKLTKAKMVVYDGTKYLPANKVAEALGASIGWAADKGKLFTSAGSAPGYLFKNTLYFDMDDMTALFGRGIKFTGSKVLI